MVTLVSAMIVKIMLLWHNFLWHINSNLGEGR